MFVAKLFAAIDGDTMVLLIVIAEVIVDIIWPIIVFIFI